MSKTPVLVLGLGNVVCGDDGAGVAAVHRLKREYKLPEGVLAVDGGTLGLSLLPLVDDADQVIIVDAIRADGPPGTLVRIEGEEVAPAVYERLSPHQIGVSDLLAGAHLLGRYPDRVIVFGVVPKAIELSMERTPAVEARIPDLVEQVVEELASIGYAPQRRTESSDEDRSMDHDVASVLGL